MLKKIGVVARIGAGLALVGLVFFVSLLEAGWSFYDLSQGVKQVDEKNLPYVLTVDEMNLSRSDVQQFLTDVAATHDRAAYKEADQAAKLFQSGIEKYKQLYQGENNPVQLKKIEEIEASFNRFYTNGKAMAEIYITQGIDAGNMLMKGDDKTAGFDKDSEVILEELTRFREEQINEAKQATKTISTSAASAISAIVVGGILAVLIIIAFSFWIIRDMQRQLGGELKYAGQVMGRIASGDLSVPVQLKANDSKSMLFRMGFMSDSLAKIVGEVRANTAAISTAAQQIAAGNSDLSQRTERQASTLEETASSIEELTSTVKQNAENAKHANQLAASASNVAIKGGIAVGDVVQTMASISASSRKIADIISVIEGIAFQTNILALNAAVEAARAGDQGRGFAVVASEVRNLAQRSAAAAKEIKALIGDSVGKVEAGSKQVDQAGATMNEIVAAVKRVTDIMHEISAASNEQSAGIEQVNQAITQIDEATQQNAALVEQAAAATESMRTQAQTLADTVSVFKLAEVNKNATAQPVLRKIPAARTAVIPMKQQRIAKIRDNENWSEF